MLVEIINKLKGMTKVLGEKRGGAEEQIEMFDEDTEETKLNRPHKPAPERGGEIVKRKLIATLTTLAIAVSLLLPVVAPAHPGRTDKKGGHYVRKSGWGYPVGSYHRHR